MGYAILAISLSDTLREKLAERHRTVIPLRTAEDAADWLWSDGKAVAEIVIGSDAIDTDLQEIVSRDWPDITMRIV